MMNMFRKDPGRTDASTRSTVAVAATAATKKNLVAPSSLHRHHHHHHNTARNDHRTADWAVEAAPTGVTDDRSDASPRVVDMESSTIASLDSFVVDRNEHEHHADGHGAPPPVPVATGLFRSPPLIKSPKNGATKIFTPPHHHSIVTTPRSSNQQQARAACKEASAYYIMDNNNDKQTKKHGKQHSNHSNTQPLSPGGTASEGDGLFWQGPQSWWQLARNRLGGNKSNNNNQTIDSSSPRKSNHHHIKIIPDDPSDGNVDANTSFWTRLAGFMCSSALVYLLLFVAMATGLTYGTMNQLLFFSNINWDEQISVGFVGTSYLFVNDIPRLLEAMSGGQVVQDSCLRSGGSLATVLLSGNGMYYRWQTNEAEISTANLDDDYFYFMADDDNGSGNNSLSLYDFGACSVHQLISGYDDYLQYGNGNQAYSDDGNNPCLVDEAYYRYITNKYSSSSKNAPAWDYVVLADQSKRMAASSESARYDTIDALVSVYAPLLQQSGSIPVIVDTHAFWSTHTNMTGLQDVPTFARMIYQGVDEYVSALAAELSTDQAPIVAPIGLAYLLIWEENYSMWQNLFLSDEMHSSLSGSYLFACVLYTKLFGHLPKRSASLPRHMEYLFAFSRRTIGADPVYPSQGEAEYLRSVAKRIVLDGDIPKSFTYSNTDDASNR